MSDSSSEKDLESSKSSISEWTRNQLEELGSYIRVTRANVILRRYFAMNAFDGSMTSLGIVIGSYISHISEPRAVLGVILLSGFAMAISGFSGTYMTESAERSRSLNELEDAMLTDLDGTIYGEASRFVSIFAAVVDGSAPFIASIPAVIPFYLSHIGVISIGTAFVISVGACLMTLFLLGVFLGRVSRNNILYSGLKMVVAGIVVALLALLLNSH